MPTSKVLSLDFIQKAIQNPLMNQKCCDLHNNSCILRAVQNFCIGAKSFSKLYFIFLFSHFLFARRKKLLSQPKEEFKKFFKAFTKSLLFAGGYLGICRAVICLVTKLYAFSELSTITSATLGGTSLIFEPMQRQPQIALFIFTNTLQIIYNLATRRNLPVRIPHGMAILYICSLAVICYHYFNNNKSLRRSYSQILDKLLKDS